ncbi:MAG: hypothetical protein ACREQL_05730 [Candidatus Binatia bacterium]
MRRRQWKHLAIGACALAVLGFSHIGHAAPLDEFARCLRNSPATFYGTFWCPQCDRQRQMFGRSERYLHYVECAYDNGGGQTPACRRARIERYPTWEFGDGSRVTGRQSLEQLSRRSGCKLPE